MSVKEKKQPKLAEGSFIIPPFAQITSLFDDERDLQSLAVKREVQETCQQIYASRVEAKQLTYNHFVSIKDQMPFECVLEKAAPLLAI